jgi:hypothetical protein
LSYRGLFRIPGASARASGKVQCSQMIAMAPSYQSEAGIRPDPKLSSGRAGRAKLVR